MKDRPYRTHKVSQLWRKPKEAADFMAEINDLDATWGRHEIEADTGKNMNGVKQDIIDLKEDEWDDIYHLVETMVRGVNRLNWQMKLTGFAQPIRVARYTPGFSHDWHLDYMPHDGSKLALSAPLNTGYEGGELQLMDVPPFDIPRGSAVVFPAYHAHRVTEVTSGVRFVLLAWFTGPRFV